MILRKLHIKHGDKTLVNIAFEFKKSLAIVGQSGSGKSLSLKAILSMLPQTLDVELELESFYELKRGLNISLVPQNPFSALSPLTKIKDQFFHTEAEEFLKIVGLDASLLKRYPNELSGGQLQRVVIAIALSIKPKVLLLDEPTTALDQQSKEMILSLLKQLQERFGFEMLFVTHDINSAKALCDEIVVIKNGFVVESGLSKDLLTNPTSPYTASLIEANFSNRRFRQ